jgi:hypothetical protein
MKNFERKYIPFYFFLTCTLLCVVAFYKIFLEKELKSKSIVNEIVKMEVNKVSIDTVDYANQIYYEYFVGNKYRIVVSRTNDVPFKSIKNDEIFIKDINGECVFSYYTRYHAIGSAWKSDYIKLMKYLNL